MGRGHYQRRKRGQEHRGYRNGYEAGRIRGAEGEIPIHVPQVRGSATPYRSRLMAFLGGQAEVLDRLVVEMHARGLSTRDIEEAFKEATGERLVSRSAVSELTGALREEYQAFSQRDLSGYEVEYLFLDAVYESLREQAGIEEGILCAWAICANGRKVMLHLALGNKESYEDWLDFLRNVVRRGLVTPVMVTSDGAPGLVRAITETWHHGLRQRCLVHKVRNVTDKVPQSARDEVRKAAQAAYYAPHRGVAEMIVTDVLKCYQGVYPSAMKSFVETLRAPGLSALSRCASQEHPHHQPPGAQLPGGEAKDQGYPAFLR